MKVIMKLEEFVSREAPDKFYQKWCFFIKQGCGNPHDDAIPNFFPHFNNSLLGLSNDVSFVSEFL